MTNQYKLVAFDMDGTLIDGRLIEVLSKKFDLFDKVKLIQSDKSMDGYIKTEKIASLLKGINQNHLFDAIDSIPFMNHAEKTVLWFKKNGFRTGIITDSYSIVAERIANKLELDFFAANELKAENNILTGEIKMPLGWEKINCSCKISICKRFHLNMFAQKYNIDIKDTIAIGDTKNDMCMLNQAGIGIAFMPKDDYILKHSKNIINNPDLNEVFNYI